MTTIDLDTLRREIRTLDYVRGTDAEDAMWREDDGDARANLAIEDMALAAETTRCSTCCATNGCPLPSPRNPAQAARPSRRRSGAGDHAC